MILRLSKCALLLGVAFFFSLVVFNNISDYEANHQFVRHILMMDTIYARSPSLWRHIDQPAIHTLFYVTIIVAEAVIAALCWWGSVRLLRCARPGVGFREAKGVGIVALTMACSLWLVAFLGIGGEWFLMWQSNGWNGQQEAFRMFVVCGVVLVYLASPEDGA